MLTWKDTGCVADSDEDDLSIVQLDDGLGNNFIHRQERIDVSAQSSAKDENTGGVDEQQRSPSWGLPQGSKHSPHKAHVDSSPLEDGRTVRESRASGVASSNDAWEKIATDADEAPDSREKEPDSTTSSPLSSLEDDFDFQNPPPFNLPASRSDGLLNSLSNNPSARAAVFDSALAAPVRTFRTRTAIQLHPYVLEKEKHSRMFRAAGYKPVILAGSQVLGESPGEKQVHDAEPPNGDQSSQDAFSLSQASVTQPNIDRYVARTALSDNEDDDLPDVETLMRQMKPGKLPKRRKLFHATILTPGQRLTNDLDGLEDVPHIASQPPTPPASHSGASPAPQDNTGRSHGFRLPKLTARGILTPKTSSPPMSSSVSRRKDTHYPSHRGSHGDIDQTLTSSASESGSVLDSGSESEVQFKSARKRIKGVLPASWLRFDSKTTSATRGKPPQEPKRNSLNTHTDLGLNGLAKGVAQRRTAPKQSSEKGVNYFDGFSSSDDGGPLPTPIRRPAAVEENTLSAPVIDTRFDSDDMEDNNIDAMLPVTSRKSKDSRKGSKRSSKTGKVLAHSRSSCNAFIPQQRTTIAQRVKPLSTCHKHRHGRDRLRQPPLSILDLEAAASEDVVSSPPFLRLAKRQARKQQNHGRHSPGRKMIRLATRADTEDALATLTAWRMGKIAQRNMASPTTQFRERGHTDLSQLNVANDANTATNSKLSFLGSLDKSDHKPRRSHEQQPRIHARFDRSENRSSTDVQQNGSSKATAAQACRTLPVRRFQLQSSTRSREVFRPAQLEVEDHRPRFDRVLGSTTLRASGTTSAIQHPSQALPPLNFQLQRFLDERPVRPLGQSNALGDSPKSLKESSSRTKFHIVRRKTKVAPKRLSVEISDFRQPVLPLAVVGDHDNPKDDRKDVAADGLQGLNDFNGQYTTDFDVRQLEPGTFFHSSTFFGSGDFANVITLRGRNLNNPAGHIIIRIDDQDTRWSAWCEETATWMGAIRNICEDAFQLMSTCDDQSTNLLNGPMETSIYLLRSLVRYISSCLHFSDPVDRAPFLLRLQRFLEDMLDIISANFQRTETGAIAGVKKHIVDCSIYVASLAFQHVIICNDELPAAPPAAPTGDAIAQLFKRMCFLVADQLFRNGCEPLQAFAEKLRHHSIRDAGIGDDDVAAKFVVALTKLSKGLGDPNFSLDSIIAELWRDRVFKSADVKGLELVWHDVFSIQPILAIDACGIYRPSSATGQEGSCWTIVKILLERTFQLYDSTPERSSTDAAIYLRTAFRRVNLLIMKWKCRGPDLALSAIYDFFAKRGLANLFGEHASGSPTFLRHLDREAKLAIETSDLAYHAFLKTLANGLRAISRNCSKTKLQRVAWRFVPNHGRTYRKDQDVRRADLDALRNHHDIFCTLYWALPTGARPRLDHIKDLVDFSTSHQEACRINIDAWRNLAVYIMSREDHQDDIALLGLWFKDFGSVIVSQYRLARSEAEELFELSKEKASGAVSFDVMQMTVTGNQRRIMDTLNVALRAVQDALDACGIKRRKLDLLKQADIAAMFKIFDAALPRTFAPVQQILVTIKRLLVPVGTDQPAAQSDESQDYGDWAGLDEIEDTMAENPPLDMVGMFQPAVHQLLSNCFGADHLVDDSLLLSLAEVWCSLAAQTVERGSRTWSHYLDAHGGDSWFQLRHTDHFSKFTPFVLSQILAADRRAFFDHEDVFLSRWLCSLVGREAVLKFQHQLTSAMLNAQTHCSLLYNLPFAVDDRLGRLDISLSELRSRRLALIGCVFSNMRATLDATRSNTADIKREYTVMLRNMMQAMKEGYQSLTSADASIATTDSSVKGAHVAFLQQVVSLMQQYTAEFCAVDSFFTDSTVFPLPSNDPKYIIARLKSYAPKLRTESGRKQLIILVQTLASNAVHAASQSALVAQLVAAISSTEIAAGPNDRALQTMILADVVPAYCSLVPTTRGAALLAIPLVEAACTIIAELRFHANVASPSFAREALQPIDFALSVIASTVGKLLCRPKDGLATEQVAFLAATFGAASKTLTTVEYASRGGGMEQESLVALRGLYDIARPGFTGADDVGVGESSAMPYRSDVAEYAATNLREVLGKQWRWRDEGFIDALGRPVAVSGVGREEEKWRAEQAMATYRAAWEAIVLGQPQVTEEEMQSLEELML